MKVSLVIIGRKHNQTSKASEFSDLSRQRSLLLPIETCYLQIKTEIISNFFIHFQFQYKNLVKGKI